MDCECPYHYDDLGCMGEGCENEGRIRVLGIGLICAQCYDDIETALTAPGDVRHALHGTHKNEDGLGDL